MSIWWWAIIKPRAGHEQVELQEVVVRLRKSDTKIEPIRILWVPWRVATDGTSEPAHALSSPQVGSHR